VFGLADPPSPTLEAVHAGATVGKRFESWLKRACKNFGKLLELKAVVDHSLRRERLEELKGDERNALLDAFEEYDKLEDSLAKLVKSKAYEDFRSWSWNEDLIKWVGQQRVSVGYCGSRERGKQYLLMDIPLESDLPYEKKVADLLELYRVSVYLRVPTQEEAERSLLEFLGWVKEWPRERLVWAVTNLYPLKDETGGFWSVATKVLALETLKEGWDDFLSDWHSTVQGELKKMPQFEVLKTVLLSEWEAGNYVRDVVDEVKKELVEKYAERVADPDDVKSEFLARAKEVFLQRVTPESKIIEAYEEVKSLVPAEKLELTKAGLAKAIRWAFLHPEMSLDAFASAHVFPFTTEEARAIASKIMEKVAKKPPPPPVVAPPAIEVISIGSDYVHDSLVAEGWKPIISIPRLEEALKAPGTGGHSTPELALEATKKQYSPDLYDFKVVKHYALHSEFPFTVFVREKKLLPKVEKPAVKSYAELEAEFKGKDAVDALASYVTNYYGLRRDYLLEDLNTYLRSLKTRLTDEDLQRFYRVYPGLKESFVAIASLISWIPPPPKDLEKIAEEALRELEGL